MSFLFRSYAQIAQDVRDWSRRLPDDVVAVCGIPRSGTIIAAILAEFRHIHLVEYSELRRGETPWAVKHRRLIPAKPRDGRVLVIDDTCWTGRTIKQARAELPASLRIEYGALYYGDLGAPHLDRLGRRLPTFQHTFEYNMLRDCLTKQVLCDMDGVLCEDWGLPDCGPEWEPKYREFLESARPLYRPCYEIAGIVTGRMARHRDATEAWLHRQGVRYQRLVMAGFPDEHARQQYGHARYKSAIYESSAADLFVESDDAQAGEIHERSGKPVLCVESMTMYGGVDPDPWPHDEVSRVSARILPDAPADIRATEPALQNSNGHALPPNGHGNGGLRSTAHGALTKPISGTLQVVISYYDARPADDLFRLLDELRTVKAGWPVKLHVVVNRETDQQLRLPERFQDVAVSVRENSGYNIGAWDHGWRNAPAAEAFLFLQDECRPVRSGWGLRFVERLNEPGVGLVGERLNPLWDRTWDELQREYAGRNEPEHLAAGRPTDRVSCYRRCFTDWGIDPQDKGDHLQALALAVRRPVLQSIGGFDCGRNKGEAIAAEIGISKRVQNLGLRITEVGPRPFWCFEHPGWKRHNLHDERIAL